METKTAFGIGRGVNGGDTWICNGIGFRRFMKKAWMPMGYKKQMLCRFCVTKLENESATERVV